jgi:hypothetical protein
MLLNEFNLGSGAEFILNKPKAQECNYVFLWKLKGYQYGGASHRQGVKVNRCLICLRCIATLRVNVPLDGLMVQTIYWFSVALGYTGICFKGCIGKSSVLTTCMKSWRKPIFLNAHCLPSRSNVFGIGISSKVSVMVTQKAWVRVA